MCLNEICSKICYSSYDEWSESRTCFTATAFQLSTSKPGRSEIEWNTSLLVCAGSVNLLGENAHSREKNTKALLLVSEKVGLEVNHEIPQYKYSCHVNNMGEKYNNIKISNNILESVTKFIYLETTVTNDNLIHEEIRSRLNAGNICYHSVQNTLSFCLLPKKNKAYRSLKFAHCFKWV